MQSLHLSKSLRCVDHAAHFGRRGERCSHSYQGGRGSRIVVRAGRLPLYTARRGGRKMSGAIRGTVGILTKGIMQLSGETSPPVEAPVKMTYPVGGDSWSIQLFNVQITLLRTPHPQVSCLIGESRFPCEIKDNKEKGTWTITVGGIGLRLKLKRSDVLTTIGKEGLG